MRDKTDNREREINRLIDRERENLGIPLNRKEKFFIGRKCLDLFLISNTKIKLCINKDIYNSKMSG